MTCVLAEEASGLLGRLGFQGVWTRAVLRAAPVFVVLIGIFGVFVPWQRGQNFFDSVILGAYACLGVVFSGPASATPFESRPSSQRALARVLISVLYGELVAITLLAVALATVYVVHKGPVIVGPNLQSLSECLLFGLTLSLAITAAAVWLAVRFSPAVSRGVVRVIFLALVAAFYVGSGWLPAIALRGAFIAFAVSILFLLALKTSLSASHTREPL
jgi:hypothetical protein